MFTRRTTMCCDFRIHLFVTTVPHLFPWDDDNTRHIHQKKISQISSNKYLNASEREIYDRNKVK